MRTLDAGTRGRDCNGRTLSRSRTSLSNLGPDFWTDVENEGFGILHSISPLRNSEPPLRRSPRKEGMAEPLTPRRRKILEKQAPSQDAESVVLESAATEQSTRHRRKRRLFSAKSEYLTEPRSPAEGEIETGDDRSPAEGEIETGDDRSVTETLTRAKLNNRWELARKPPRRRDPLIIASNKDKPLKTSVLPHQTPTPHGQKKEERDEDDGGRKSETLTLGTSSEHLGSTPALRTTGQEPKVPVPCSTGLLSASVDSPKTPKSLRLRRALRMINSHETKRRKHISDRRKSNEGPGGRVISGGKDETRDGSPGEIFTMRQTSSGGPQNDVHSCQLFPGSQKTPKSSRARRASARLARFEERRHQRIRTSCGSRADQHVNEREASYEEASRQEGERSFPDFSSPRPASLGHVDPQESGSEPLPLPKSTRSERVRARIVQFEERRWKHIQHNRKLHESLVGLPLNKLEPRLHGPKGIAPDQQTNLQTLTAGVRHFTLFGVDPQNKCKKSGRHHNVKARIVDFEKKRRKGIQVRRLSCESSGDQSISQEGDTDQENCLRGLPARLNATPDVSVHRSVDSQITAPIPRMLPATFYGVRTGITHLNPQTIDEPDETKNQNHTPCKLSKQDHALDINATPLKPNRSVLMTPSASICCSSCGCTCRCRPSLTTQSSISKAVQVSPSDLGAGPSSGAPTGPRQAPADGRGQPPTSRDQTCQTDKQRNSESSPGTGFLTNHVCPPDSSHLISLLETKRTDIVSHLFKSPPVNSRKLRHTPLLRRTHSRRSSVPPGSSTESGKSDTNSVSSRSSVEVLTQPNEAARSLKGQTLPHPIPLGSVRFTVNRSRYLDRRRKATEAECLFSSEEETDPDVVGARAAAATFLLRSQVGGSSSDSSAIEDSHGIRTDGQGGEKHQGAGAGGDSKSDGGGIDDHSDSDGSDADASSGGNHSSSVVGGDDIDGNGDDCSDAVARDARGASHPAGSSKTVSFSRNKLKRKTRHDSSAKDGLLKSATKNLHLDRGTDNWTGKCGSKKTAKGCSSRKDAPKDKKAKGSKSGGRTRKNVLETLQTHVISSVEIQEKLASDAVARGASHPTGSSKTVSSSRNKLKRKTRHDSSVKDGMLKSATKNLHLDRGTDNWTGKCGSKKTAKGCSSRKDAPKDKKAKGSKSGGRTRKKVLETLQTQVISSVEMQQKLAKRTEINRAICQSMIPPFPVEWEEPAMSDTLRRKHSHFLQTALFRMLTRQCRQKRLSKLPARQWPNVDEQRRARSKEKQSTKRLTAEVESLGWANHEILPQIYREPDTKSFIQKIRKNSLPVF